MKRDDVIYIVLGLIGICFVCFGLGMIVSEKKSVHAQSGYVAPPPPLGTLVCKDNVAPTWQHVMGNFVGKETRKGLDLWMCVETFEEMNKE